MPSPSGGPLVADGGPAEAGARPATGDYVVGGSGVAAPSTLCRFDVSLIPPSCPPITSFPLRRPTQKQKRPGITWPFGAGDGT